MSESEARATARAVAGQYNLLSELGRGGMGVVWLAEDVVTGRRVAVKELRPPVGSTDEDRGAYMQRAYQEARSAAQISHPNAVTLHHVIPARAGDDTIYLIMEFVDGPTLTGLVAQHGGSLASPLVAKIGLQMLDVLAEAHQLGIVHRDIKPGNILIARGERAKLTDFGIAHIMGRARITRAGGVAGTLAYMAPELFEGQPIAASGDLWSLGATLFYAVAGWAPFDRDTDAATMRAILTEPIPVPGCAQDLASAISGLLRRDPGQRLTIDGARDLLRRVPEQEGTPMWQGSAVPISSPAPPVLPDASRSASAYPSDPSHPSHPSYPSHPSDPSDSPTGLATRLDAVPGPATHPPAPQPGPASRRRTVIIASSVAGAVVVLAGAITGVVLATGGGKAHHPGGGTAPALTAPPLAPKGPALKAPGGGSATSVSFNAAGTMLAAADNASAAGANKAPEWNAASRTQTATFPYFGASHDLAFSPSGQLLAIAGSNLYVWNAASHANTAYQFDTIPRAVAFSPDGKTLAVGGQLRTNSTPVVRLLDSASGKWTSTLPGLPSAARVSAVAFSPDGKTLAASDPGSGAVYLWNTASKTLTGAVKPGAVAGPIAFSPDGKTLAVAAGSGQVKLVNAATHATASVVTDPGSKGVKSVAFSHDGQTLAVADGDGIVNVWNVSAGKLAAQASVPGVASVAFSPDGKTLATGSGSGQVRVWAAPGQ